MKTFVPTFDQFLNEKYELHSSKSDEVDLNELKTVIKPYQLEYQENRKLWIDNGKKKMTITSLIPVIVTNHKEILIPRDSSSYSGVQRITFMSVTRHNQSSAEKHVVNTKKLLDSDIEKIKRGYMFFIDSDKVKEVTLDLIDYLTSLYHSKEYAEQQKKEMLYGVK